MSPNEAAAIARKRIDQEAERQTGSLDLSGLWLDAIPQEIACLTTLQQLNCSGTKVSDLSPLASLPVLQRLECWDTQVSDLSPLANLAALRQLNCRRTKVSDLSPLSSLTALHQLYCSYTKVGDLSPLANLTALRQLSCGHTKVSDLSPLASVTTLRYLNCHYTQVSDLSPLATLTALQKLDCDNTGVSDLSPLASLTALQKLDCSRCRPHSLPSFLLDNTALELAAFEAQVPGLPYGLLSRDLIDDCRERVRAHYVDLAQDPAELSDVRLFLLGNGAAGKTQIARWLSGEEFDPDWNSTHGIMILDRPHPDSIAATLHLQMWDFGGQDIYHGTHAMFLRGPAVLVPVWAKDRENRNTYEHGGLKFRNDPLDYWIAVVKNQADPQNPVLITQTKCDGKDQEQRRFPLSGEAEEALRALPYVTELRVSPKTGRGRGALEDALKDAVLWLRDPNRLGRPQIGAGRLRVQRRLEAMRAAEMALPREQRRHRLLEHAEFDAICAEEGGVTSPALLLDYLNANGTVFYRPGMFLDRIVLDLGWALEAIYAVFDRKQVYAIVKKQDGRISRADLARLVWQDQPETEQNLLLSMMVSCGMCFLHRSFGDDEDDNAEYIVPDLLPDQQAIAPNLLSRWADDRPGESASFRYPLLQGGVIRSIMSKIGQLAGVNALYWRGGFCVFDADTRSRLLIEEKMTGDWRGEIRLRTQDGQAASLLQKAVELVERANTSCSVRPDGFESTQPASEHPTPDRKIEPASEPTTTPEWYISYAWGDNDTPEGRARSEIVELLCQAAIDHGHRILRDKEEQSLGDSISAFMKKIGTGDRVFVILSDKYLRSPFCMFELSEVWRTSRQEQKYFRDRVRIYALPDATFKKPQDWVKWAAHWQAEFNDLDALARQHGATSLGDPGWRRLKQMQTFYMQVPDILGTIADMVLPRTLEQLKLYGFDDGSPRT